MAWIKATSELTPTWQQKDKELEKGASVEGVLVEKRSGIGRNGNSNLYIIEQKGGAKIGVWGSVILDMRLHDKVIGTLLKITYMGKEKSKKSGNNVNLYDVEYDDSTTEAQANKIFNPNS